MNLLFRNMETQEPYRNSNAGTYSSTNRGTAAAFQPCKLPHHRYNADTASLSCPGSLWVGRMSLENNIIDADDYQGIFLKRMFSCYLLFIQP
jgi:hypothetical protein